MKKALMVWGGWAGHQPQETVEAMAPSLSEAGFDVEIVNSLDVYTDEAKMKSLSLIVHNVTMHQINNEQLQGLQTTIASGVGLAGWHGGLCDSFHNSPLYQFMTGGQFVAHPGNIIDYRVNIIDHEDEVTKGIPDFAVHSEQYYMHVDPGNKILATTLVEGNHGVYEWTKGVVMPVVWKKPWGEGRVFYSALGHSAEEFAVPEMKEIMRRGMLWAAR
jgi:type 1 glutamine amidotransferase